MARNKTEFGRPVQSPEDVPDHLKKYKKAPFLINGTIDDFGWYGDDGNLDREPIISEMIDPAALLRLVVQPIVNGYPSTDKCVEDRVEAAIRALLGTRGRKGRRGRLLDGSVLRRMSVEYLHGFYGFKNPHPSLNALANWALHAEPNFAKGNEEWKEGRRRTIARKFLKFKDQLLVEASSGYDMEVQLALARVKTALMALQGMGVRLQPLGQDWTKKSQINP